MVMVTAVVKVVVVISSNLFECLFCGGICGIISGNDVNGGYGGSPFAYHFHH